MANNIPFLPARGKESDILARSPSDGMVWFATDTRKIYYSNGTDFISMGGNSGIYYGQMHTAETPEEGQKDFDFLPEDIEGNEDDDNQVIPNPNDLIFNSPDNSFYRVIEVEKDEIGSTIIHTRLLTVAGGGGGSGGGEGGGESTTGKMTLSRLGNSEVTVLEGASCLIGVHFTAIDASGEQTGNGVATIWVGGTKRATQTIILGDSWIDVGKYLDADSLIVLIYVEASIGGLSTVTQNKRWTVNKVRLNIEWEYNDNIILSGNDVLLTYAVSTNIPHQVHIIVDDMYSVLPPPGSSTLTLTYRLAKNYGLTHGAHKVSMYVTADIGGTTITSATVNHTILYQEIDNTSPIIAFLNYNNNMTQYDTLLIPIIVFDPTNTSGEISLILREDGTERDIWTIPNGSTNTWSYTPTLPGIHRLLVVCNNTEAYQDIDVAELVLNNEEISGYEFKFKASDFISNNTVQNWNSNGITATFSDNFDWHNGGLHIEETENGSRLYFCIKAGTTMTINAKPFSNLSANRGKTIKFIYKATNCRNYDALVLSCYEEFSNIDSRGLLVNAQNAKISCQSASLNVPFCEDSYIELEMDVWNGLVTRSGVKQNYLMVWIDGVPAGCKVYTDGTEFSHNKSITIGSDDCDVYVYLIKTYDRHLTEDLHLANFIADAYNALEMIMRYRRNDILGDNGDISYSKLALAAPNVKLHLYDIPRMTAAKGDKVTGCSYQLFYGSTEAEVSASNVTIQGQGTSSSRYGISAFNLDSKFENGFDYPDGSHTKNYSMTPTSIGVNYFNTKVNVASCENANNALNQEWYNKWLPFVCEYKAKNAQRDDGKMARDTMEFPYPGVVFVKDNNPITTNTADGAVNNNCFIDTAGYVNNPYYKMYAVCNMGNSKKNTAVFHDADNPYECCVENLDNQRPELWMTDVSTVNPDNIEANVYVDENGKGQGVYEFRYIPDDADTVVFSNAWYRLVSWMAENNPDAATNEPLPESETYAEYTFKGYVSDKTNYRPEREILRGNKVTTYAGTYTHDTYERRMAKMLSECEDYLIMDAMVYHYLMIERHTLIDNVAKNTFWGTEDLVHWQMIKDYDNDTSDGNDNQGALTLGYGYEILDTVRGKDIKVFNATPSVWLHFIHGLYLARQTVYLALDTLTNGESAWDADAYLKRFEEYQNAIPERCWIYDYHKKYLRPYEVYGEAGYIFMLEGGKKTHLRRQYEIYQQEYMASEYFGRNAHSSAIEFRGNNPPPGVVINEKTITITMYSDCYINAAFGNGDSPNVTMRVSRNVPTTITVPTPDMNNATIYFYSAGNITALDGIYNLFSLVAKIAAARRLREFSLGSDNFNNTNITEIEFGANTMLEKLNLQNLPNLAVGLNLNGLTSLREVNTLGSGFTTVTIGSNAPVRSLKLNPIGRLELTNLYDLEELDIESYENLGSIYINNIDNNIVNSKNIIMNAMNAIDNQGRNVFKTYMLNNILWTIDNANELSNTLPAIITILNNLLINEREPRKIINGSPELATRKEAVTGNLTITNNAYSGNNSLDVYNYYAFGTASDGELNFPGLDINFTGNLKLFTFTIFNGQNLPIWTKKLLATTDINTEFLSSGPDGNFLNITMENYLDTASTYSFKHAWDLHIGEDIIRINGEAPLYSHVNEINDDIYAYPVYENEPRLYTATFIVNGETFTQAADYNTLITDVATMQFPDGLHKSDVNLPFNMTYKFEGWTLMEASTNIISNNITLTGDNVFYAYFKEIDVHTNIDTTLFDWRLSEGENIGSYNPVTGEDTRSITIYPLNPAALKGKITIPKAIGTHPVTLLYSSFNECTDLTHIFFESGSLVNRIWSNAFSNLTKLIYFEPIDSLRLVGRNAFLRTNLTIGLDGNNYYLVGGNNLETVEESAFQNAFTAKNNQSGCELLIPASLITITTNAFSWQKLSNFTIKLGSVDNPSKWNALYNIGKNNTINNSGRFSLNNPTNFWFYTRLYTNQYDVILPRENSADEEGYTLANAITDANGSGNITINIEPIS